MFSSLNTYLKEIQASNAPRRRPYNFVRRGIYLAEQEAIILFISHISPRFGLKTCWEVTNNKLRSSDPHVRLEPSLVCQIHITVNEY